MDKLRRNSGPAALAIACVALVAALTGSAIGLPGSKNIDSNDLKQNVVKAKNIKLDAVTGPKILAGAVSAAKIQDGAVSGAKVQDGSLGLTEVAPEARVMWAHVSAAGVILSQSGGITIDAVGTPGAYGLDFPRSTRGYALMASLNQPGNTDDADNIEVIRFGSGPGEGTGGLPSEVAVHTRNAAEAFEPENFTVTAIP